MIITTKRKGLIFGLILTTLLSSCVTTYVADLQRDASNEVDVFTTQMPTREYKELKYIRIDGSVFNKPERLLSELTQAAKSEGADAIINIQYTFKSTWSMITGTAIKYND